MGLPSKKRTNRSKRDRASHFALKAATLGKCEKCSSATLPHHAGSACGFYRGRQAVKVEKRAARLARHKKLIGKK